MPKIVSEAERAEVREAIYSAAILLIRQKGIRKITVDDIARAVGISKGGFYSYYSSREICIYEVLRRSENELFARMESIMASRSPDRQSIVACLREVFLAPDSIILYLSPTDLEALLRKLPPEYRESEQRKADDYFQRSLKLLKVETNKMEALAMLTDCLSVVATNTMFGENGRQQALDVLVLAMADYLAREDNI